jgi:hypothetical protein
MGITSDCSSTSQRVGKASISGNPPSHRAGRHDTVRRRGCPSPPSTVATPVALTCYAPCLAHYESMGRSLRCWIARPEALPSPMAVEATAWREYTVVLNSIGIKPATDVPDWRIRAKS